MTDKLCFTTCLNEKFIPGAKGTILSIRKFYTPEEADIVVFIDNIYPEFDQFCQTHSVDIQYFSSIKDWVLPLIYSQDRYKNDKTHYYHPDFALHENVPFNVDTKRDLGFHKLHHLHPLNVKAYCTGYCLLIKDYKKVVHIDSDAFLLSKIDEIFDAYAQENTVIGFDDGNDNLENLEYLYGVKKPDTWTPQTYAFNAGIVFYRNGEFIKELMKDFCFYIDSCYHYDKSGSFADQGLLRALVAVYNIQGCIQFHRLPAENWNPTWRRADTLEFQNNIWINKKNGQKQRIWHGAGEEKLWTGKYDSASVNEAWSWIGGELPPKNNKLVITKAIYGYGDKAKDVTDIIRDKKLIHNDNDSLDRTIGDPNPGVEKEITVYFHQHGREIIKKYKKHQDIDLYVDDKLIYLTPKGYEYREMAKHCVISLRNKGNFWGKILIYADEYDDNLKSISHLATIVIVKLSPDALMNRLFAMEYINPSPYKNIMYLDCDILAYKDVNDLFRANDEVLYMEEPWHYNKNTWAGTIDTYYFTEEERTKTYADFHPINTGHFCVDSTLFLELYEKYKEEYFSKGGWAWGQDQASFNAMIRRGKIKAKPFDKNEICIADKTKPEDWEKYSLVHFAGFGGRLNKMKEICPDIVHHQHTLKGLLSKYGSDKSTRHSYDEIYDNLFHHLRNKPITLLESGVLSGASLNAFSDYFPKAMIYGIDTDDNIIKQKYISNRITVKVGDSTNEDISQILEGLKFDIIIDDGAHDPKKQEKTFNNLQKFLQPNGLYIIEDILDVDKEMNNSFFSKFICLDRRRIKGEYSDVLMLYKNSIRE